MLISAGDIERGRFELMGTVPNIAARLSDAAGPHEIVVSDETLGPARRFFGAGAPSMLSVKGREAPILVYRIEARAETAAGAQARGRPRAPIVGRQTEFERLAQALDTACTGQPAGVEVVGPPGIGKTRLVEEFLHHARQCDCRVLRGSCESDLSSAPLQPFRQMLHSLGVVEPPSGPRAWGEWFERLAAEQPLVLFVDDWQWADDASHHVLAATQRLSTLRLLIVLTRRLSGAPAGITPGFEAIALAPLDDATAAQAVAAQLPGSDPFVVAQICARAGGNPLFIEELCHSAARGDSGRLAASSSPAGWINQLIESRVQHLSPTLVDMVRTAAVIGNSVPAWLLARIIGCAPDSSLVRDLAEHDFLFPGEHAGTLRFKHGVTRDVIYASVGLLARQLLHLRIGAALMQHAAASGEEDAEALALHFGAGGDPAMEAHYAERAGDRALAVSALDRARAHYRAALAALERGELAGVRALRWVDIVQRLAMVCMFDPERNQIGLMERAVALAERHGDAPGVARARHWLGCVNYALGEPRAAIAHGERALLQAEQAGDEPLAVQAMASLGEALAAAGQYARAAALLDRAIEVKRSHRSGRHTNVGLAYSLVCRGVLLGDHGRFATAARVFRPGAGMRRRLDAPDRRQHPGLARRGAAVAGPLGRGTPRGGRVGPHRRGDAQLVAVVDRACDRRLRAVDARAQAGGGGRHRRRHRLAVAARQRTVPLPEPRLVGRGPADAGPTGRGATACPAGAAAGPPRRPHRRWRWRAARWRARRRRRGGPTRHNASWPAPTAWRAGAIRRMNSP